MVGSVEVPRSLASLSSVLANVSLNVYEIGMVSEMTSTSLDADLTPGALTVNVYVPFKEREPTGVAVNRTTYGK